MPFYPHENPCISIHTPSLLYHPSGYPFECSPAQL